MYSFINSVSLSRSMGSQWHAGDILASTPLHDIVNSYSKVYLTLHDIIADTNIYVDMQSILPGITDYTITLAAAIINLGDRALPTVSELPSSTIHHAIYEDAFRAEYKINPTQIGMVVPDGYPVSDLHDLTLTRPRYNTDMALIHSHCLVSVNGYYHQTDTDGSKAYVYKGADTMRQSRVNHLGILSFLNIGALTKVSIDPLDIYGQTDVAPLKEKIFFTVPNVLDGKSYLLVLGGYLVFPEDNVFWRNGDHSFALDINKLPYLERLCESQIYMDLSALSLLESPINPSLINLDNAYSDIVLKEYLTLSQSFLVIIDTPNLITNHIHLRHSSLPGMFTSYQDPKYPLIANYGKVCEYWKTYEDQQWSVTVGDSFLRNFIFTQQPAYQLQNLTDQLNSTIPFFHSRGYLLEIAGYQ